MNAMTDTNLTRLRLPASELRIGDRLSNYYGKPTDPVADVQHGGAGTRVTYRLLHRAPWQPLQADTVVTIFRDARLENVDLRDVNTIGVRGVVENEILRRHADGRPRIVARVMAAHADEAAELTDLIREVTR